MRAKWTWPPIRGVALALLLCSGVGDVQAQPIDERKVSMIKAAYVFHMLQLTTWPGDPTPTDTPLRVVFVGQDATAVGDVLAAQASLHRINGRLLQVDQLPDAPSDPAEIPALCDRLQGCQIIYLGADAADILEPVRAAAGTGPVLLAGDGSEFPRRGGMVGFFVDEQRVRINVNLDEVLGAGLRLSAEFLQHVELVSAGGD